MLRAKMYDPGKKGRDSDSPPAAMEGSISAAPRVAIPSRIMVISEGEIKLLKEDLHKLSQLILGLVAEFDKLQYHLEDVSQTEHPSITAKCWMTQVRELYYDTGDYLYDFIHSGKEFKIFKARAEDTSERFVRYGIQPKTTSMPMVRRLPAPPSADLIDDVHKDMVDEVASLLGTTEKLKVVSIVGPEGVSKTTLAKGIYRRYIRGSGNFQFWAFLKVSAQPDILRLLISMFIQIQREKPSHLLTAHQLIDNIAVYLQDKRYFIIVDDLWNEDVWGIISHAFPGGDCCSRVITTTQIKGVALACCGHESKNVFKMEPLSAAQSEKLFFWTAFGSESGCPVDLKEVSDKIIRKCGGLPLACINIASMLPSTLKLEEWTCVLNSLPSTGSTNPSSEWMKELVTLMYSTLKPHLKTCLLCFSMYPEGCIVRKNDLVRQWVLEGFLDRGTEEIAGRYFDELVTRGMIQPVNTNKKGQALSCTLHRIIHDVIVKQSMEENFVIMVDYSESSIALPDKVRRLSVQKFRGSRSASIPDSIVVSKLRSFVLFGLFQCLPSIDQYSLLRVLILHIWADQEKDSIDLAGIRELLRLRYLKISSDIAVKLPDEIQAQQVLKILEVDATLSAIPWDIGELGKLRTFKFAVSELSSEDICVLQELVALTVLCVYVKTAPTKTIVIGEGGFCDLKFFSFRCSAPSLLIQKESMPKIENLNLCFNAHEARQDGTKPIIIRHLPGLKKIRAKIEGAVADADSALADAITNDENNPNPKLMEPGDDIEHGTPEEEDEIMEEDPHDYLGSQEEGSEECGNTEDARDETEDDGLAKDEAASRISVQPGSSSHLHVPVAAVGWGIATAGWILSPVFTRLMDKALSHMEPGESKNNFSKLVTDIIPRLKLKLEAAESREDKVFFEKMVRELKSNFYEVEEALDELDYDYLESQLASTDDAGPTKKGFTFKSSGKLPESVKKRLTENLKNIGQALEEARDNIILDKLPSDRRSVQRTLEVKDRCKTTSGEPKVQLIGRDEHLRQITKWLHDRRPSSFVINIYGIAGSGKTTLAQHVYRSEKRTDNFELLMWIHVSRKFSVGDIFREMLKQIAGNGTAYSQENCIAEMRAELEEELRNTIFLLVLDDIWCDKDSDKYKLYELFSLLNQVNYDGSRILVTSRNKNAISAMGHDVENTTIEMQDFSEKDFNSLLMYHAVGENMIAKESLKAIGTQIAKRLKGSPLAATLVGGLLRKEMTVDHWLSVYDDPYLLKGIIGIMWLCYQHLDEQARRCFAYCSIFPIRHRFDRDEIVKLWVAEGFIEATDTGKMEEIGNIYFGEFVSISFMQQGEKDFNGGKEYFVAHDLLHDIAELFAGTDCFRIEKGWRGEVPLDVRHLFVETLYRLLMKDLVKLEKLRSLIILTGENSIGGEEVLQDMLKNKRLRKLRVLVIKTTTSIPDIYTLLESIGDLKHMRYLAFGWRFGDRIRLPDTFTKLYHMQVLDFGDPPALFTSEGSDEMELFYPSWNGPAYLEISYAGDMIKLINLRHLIVQCRLVNIGRLTSLEILPYFQISGEPGYELFQLRRLDKLRGKLKIVGLEHVKSKDEALLASLADKEGLRELALEWVYPGYGEMRVTEKVQADVLEGLCPSERLEELQIINYKGGRYPNWMADQHRSWHVKRLVLKNCSKLVIRSSPFFSNLLRLTFQECEWDALPDYMEHLHKLTVLIIYRCQKIKSLGELPRSLKYLEICGCGYAIEEFCREDPNWNFKIKGIERRFIGSRRLQDSSKYPDEHSGIHRILATLHGKDSDGGMEENWDSDDEEDNEDLTVLQIKDG